MPMVADVAARTRVKASIMHEHVAMQLGHQRRLECLARGRTGAVDKLVVGGSTLAAGAVVSWQEA